MAKAKSPWDDSSLRALARRRVTLPLEIAELSHAAVKHKLKRFLIITMAAEFVGLGILFAALGVFPGFIDRDAFTSVDPGAETALLAVLLGVPLFTAGLVLLLIHRRVRRRPDEQDHPWRFQVTTEGLTLSTAQGQRFAGPWATWYYDGYSYMQIKMNRFPIGLSIAREGRSFAIEFSRFRRRDSAVLCAAVLQGLVTAGHTDRPAGASGG